MSKKSIVWLIVAIIVVIGLIWWGVSYEKPAPVVEEKEAIKIGVISPLTGSAASYGDPAAKAVILAAEEINENGGILNKKIDLIVEDGACDATTTLNAVNKLAHIDQVKIILGGHCSTESLTIAPIANENKIIQLASITSSDKYTDAGDYSFRNWPTSDYYVAKLGDIAYEKGARKIAILFEQKDFPSSATESFKKRFVELGGKVVIEQSFISTERDFRSYLLKIRNEKDVDSLFFASQGEDLATIYFKTLKELDILDKYQLFANNEPISKKVYDETGGLNANVPTTNVYVDPKRPLTKKLLEAYKNKYGQYPQTNNFYVACSYDALYLIKDAIEHCEKVDTECIKEFLYNVKDWGKTAGSLTFDQNGDALTTIGLHYFDSNGNEIWEELN